MRRNTSNKALYSCFSDYAKLFTICLLLLIVSCTAKKQLVVKRPAGDTAQKAAVDTKLVKINAIKAAQTNFDTFSGKARTKLDINGSSNDVTLNIRIKRDQKIWVSVTAIAGIEVARALITPDSVLLINRLQSEYVKQPFSYVKKLAGDQVNYKTVESLLIGNAIPELLNENADFETANGITTINGNLQDIIYKVLLGADMKVNQTNLNNQDAAQSLQVLNSVYIQAGNRVMPSQIDISSIVKDKKILVNLHYVKVDFDLALDFPFSIPSRYNPTKIN
jgi:hypothetical protein